MILDNFSLHKKPERARWALETNVLLVWTPANASWKNHIEWQFIKFKLFVFTKSEYKSHKPVNTAINDLLRCRSGRNAKRKNTYL